MKVAAVILVVAPLLAALPASAFAPSLPYATGSGLTSIQLQSDRTITSQPNPRLRSRGTDLGNEGGPLTSPSFEPRSRIRPYRWVPGAEILDERDLGLGLVEPDPLLSDPLIGDPTLDGADSGVTGVPGSGATIPGTGTGP